MTDPTPPQQPQQPPDDGHDDTIDPRDVVDPDQFPDADDEG
jgi:hypothetical protein